MASGTRQQKLLMSYQGVGARKQENFIDSPKIVANHVSDFMFSALCQVAQSKRKADVLISLTKKPGYVVGPQVA